MIGAFQRAKIQIRGHVRTHPGAGRTVALTAEMRLVRGLRNQGRGALSARVQLESAALIGPDPLENAVLPMTLLGHLTSIPNNPFSEATLPSAVPCPAIPVPPFELASLPAAMRPNTIPPKPFSRAMHPRTIPPTIPVPLIRLATLSTTLPTPTSIPKLPPELSTVTRSTIPPWPVIRIPSDPVPRIVPLKIRTLRGPGSPPNSPACTPTPLPGSSHLVGLGVHTTGPIMLKPFKSIVTRSAVTTIAVVSRSGSVRLLDRR